MAHISALQASAALNGRTAVQARKLSEKLRTETESGLSGRESFKLNSGTATSFPSESSVRVQRSTSSRRLMRVFAIADSPSVGVAVAPPKVGEWTWEFQGKSIKISYASYAPAKSGGTQDLILLPAISDVSTADEFAAVATTLSKSLDDVRQTIVVDWPGFGLSDRPIIDYTVDTMERFLTDFLSSSGPLKGAVPTIIGAGHSSTIAARAIGRGLVKAARLVAVAPTWAGPLPIVFGKDATMEGRYGWFRGLLQTPWLGQAIYTYTVASPSNIRSQYLTHVYADPTNLTDAVVAARAELPQRENARFGSSAFITGLLDPASTREEYLSLFAALAQKNVPAFVLKSVKSPKRSNAEMEALRNASGVLKFVEVPGALLPHEEYADEVSKEIVNWLSSS